MIKDSVKIISNALMDMYHKYNITLPPTNCNSANKWQTGPLFYDILKKQTLNGYSGRIKFDESGDRLYSEYEILNLSNNTQIGVGKYSFDSDQMKMKLSLWTHQIKWPGNLTQKPMGYYVPKHLRIATLPEKPFVWIRPTLNTSCGLNEIPCPRFNRSTYEYDDFCCKGYCIDLLKALSLKLNFSYDLVLVNDGQYGSLNFIDENGPRVWTGLVGELVYKRVDMVVAPLTANPERFVREYFTGIFLKKMFFAIILEVK